MGQQAQSTTNKGTKLYYLAIHIPKLTHGPLCKSGNRKQGGGYMKNKQHASDARWPYLDLSKRPDAGPVGVLGWRHINPGRWQFGCRRGRRHSLAVGAQYRRPWRKHNTSPTHLARRGREWAVEEEKRVRRRWRDEVEVEYLDPSVDIGGGEVRRRWRLAVATAAGVGSHNTRPQDSEPVTTHTNGSPVQKPTPKSPFDPAPLVGLRWVASDMWAQGEYKRWVWVGWVRKTIHFWQKHSKLRFFGTS
jgi:hypothetical protein